MSYYTPFRLQFATTDDALFYHLQGPQKKKTFTRSNNAQPLIVKLYFVISPAAHYLMLFNPLTSHESMLCDGGQTIDVVVGGVVGVVGVVVVVPK